MLRIREAIVVEGRYDKNTLSQVVDTVIVTTNGFGIFKDKAQLALLRRLAAERGLLRSGGSDFHGDRKPNRLGEGLGQLFVPVAWAEKPENKDKKNAPG